MAAENKEVPRTNENVCRSIGVVFITRLMLSLCKKEGRWTEMSELCMA